MIVHAVRNATATVSVISHAYVQGNVRLSMQSESRRSRGAAAAQPQHVRRTKARSGYLRGCSLVHHGGHAGRAAGGSARGPPGRAARRLLRACWAGERVRRVNG